jgi:hypothetical protein
MRVSKVLGALENRLTFERIQAAVLGRRRCMAKVFSCLRSLPEEIYQQGLVRLEADLLK